MTKSKRERTVVDDLIETGRDVIEKLDALINPAKKRRKARVPVPVPVRNPRDPQNRSPYGY